MSQNGIKNICLTINSLASGGAEKQCLLLASLLKDTYRIQVVIIDDQPVYQGHLDFLHENNIDHIFLKGKTLEKITSLRSLLRKNHTDIVFSYLPRDIAVSAIAGHGIVKKHIGGIRNALMEKTKIRILKFFHNRLLDASISNCVSGKEFFSQQGLRADKIFVIPNGIYIENQPLRRQDSRPITISSLGRLVEQKDFETAIKSISYLQSIIDSSRIQVKLNIVGNGPLKEKLQNKIIELGLLDSICIIHNATNLGSILLKTDIYLCTSIFEGVSNAIMEAMAHSLPIVATDAGDNKMLVKHGINGYIFPLKDHIGIGNALKELIDDYDKRISYGLKSHDILKHNHDVSVFRDRYLKFIEDLK